MIERLSLRRVATYDETGVTFENLKTINFIYGVNGSGKTTISNYLSDISNLKYNGCDIKWKNDLSLDIVVYHKNFKDLNFNSSEIKGVFTLGQATQKDIDEIKLKKNELDNINLELKEKLEFKSSREEVLESEQIAFKEKVWQDILKSSDESFKPAFSGFQNSKENFSGRVLREFQNNHSPLLTKSEIYEKTKAIFSSDTSNLDFVIVPDFLFHSEIEKNSIWENKIIGSGDVKIAELIGRLSNSDWVNKGREYINDDYICPFCQKMTIDEDFRSQLKQYFDDTFSAKISELQTLKNQYFTRTETLLNTIDVIIRHEKENSKSKLDLLTIEANLSTLTSTVSLNKELIEKKIAEPNRVIKLFSISEQEKLIVQKINEANLSISKHNEIIKNYYLEKDKLVHSIWRFIIEENKTTIEPHFKKTDSIRKQLILCDTHISELKAKINQLKTEIIELNKNVTSVQPTVDEINKTLKSFGFLNFEIV
ncbi:MAG: hypothetical protein CMP77_15235 [Flavobacterium sp.]|nr:hypothetical protein [Flavobacterium sp.]|tara:strand:+ start:3845 stop:5290 length:1446 start_codon:yes stop_codon:yes gene_type:complete